VAEVARQTIATRQTFLNQVTALASNKLRSELDVSFASVNLDESRLLLSKAQNDLLGAFSRLAAVMGSRESRSYSLVEEPLPGELSTNTGTFVEQALQERPALLALRNAGQAASRFARAERAARFPVVSAVGSAGVVPIHDPQLPDTYAAAGLTLNLPL